MDKGSTLMLQSGNSFGKKEALVPLQPPKLAGADSSAVSDSKSVLSNPTATMEPNPKAEVSMLS